MAQCVTCGTELHPERAEKYDYCTKRECREQNATPLTIAAVAVNKAADQYLVLNDQAREDLAAGKYRTSARPPRSPTAPVTSAPRPAPPPASPAAARPPRNHPAPPGPSPRRTSP